MFRYTLRGRERGEGDIITDEGEGNMDGVGEEDLGWGKRGRVSKRIRPTKWRVTPQRKKGNVSSRVLSLVSPDRDPFPNVSETWPRKTLIAFALHIPFNSLFSNKAGSTYCC